MTSPDPIKVELFRFATVRTPQLITEEKKSVGFVFHPDPSKSKFLQDISTDDLKVARMAVRSIAATFSPLKNHAEVRSLDADVFDFSAWLMKNRRNLTKDSALNHGISLDRLEPSVVLTAWDNLFYYTLKRTHASVRQACQQLILADNYIARRKEPNILELASTLMLVPRTPLPPTTEERVVLFFKRLASAAIVLPKAFSTGRDYRTRASSHNWNLAAFEDLERVQNLAIAKRITTKLSTIRAELFAARSRLSVNEMSVPSLLGQGLTGQLSLSKSTARYLEHVGKATTSLDEVDRSLRKSVRSAANAGARNMGSTKRTVLKRGRIMNTAVADPYRFTAKLQEETDGNSVYMTIDVGQDNAFIRSSQYSIQFGNEKRSDAESVEVLSQLGNFLNLRLFPDRTVEFDRQSTYRLAGKVQLGTGQTLVFDVEGSLETRVTPGRATPNDPVDDGSSDDQGNSNDDEIELYGVNRIGVADLRKVEQEVCCYVPGEVSRIENILAREYKERQTRSLQSSETTEEDTTEVEVESQTDTATTERNEILTEIAQVLSDDDSTSYGASVGVSGKAFGAEVEADAYIDYASSTSSSISDSVAKTYAEEVTNEALERVLQKTTQKRTSTILKEYEENNRHGFDNREGDSHVTGVYRWVDIIYKNRLVNYGKRLMFEFLVPQPSKFYRLAVEAQAEASSQAASDTTVLEEPTSPEDNGISSASDITQDNYLDLARVYEVTIATPPSPDQQDLTKSFGPEDDPKGDSTPNAKELSYNFDFVIEPNYRALSATVECNFDYHCYSPTELGTYFKLTVGNDTYKLDEDDLDRTGAGDTENKEKTWSITFSETWVETLPVKVEIKNVYAFDVVVQLSLQLEDSVMEEWQATAYDTIVRGYEAQVAAYEAAIAEAAATATSEDATEVGSSDLNRVVEQRELQRICIEMIASPFGIEIGRNFYSVDAKSCGFSIPSVIQTEEWRAYSSHVKFFEQAFEWDSMAYIFYPYYWGKKCDWLDLLQSSSTGDLIFEGFLQSGMARVLVPVRPGFEEAIDYYMETGDIWNGGGLVLESDDDLYLSIAEELHTVDGFVEEEWQTRVPTTLTIVQGKSVYLDDEGLPCCEEVDNGVTDTLFKASTAILGTSTSGSAG